MIKLQKKRYLLVELSLISSVHYYLLKAGFVSLFAKNVTLKNSKEENKRI